MATGSARGANSLDFNNLIRTMLQMPPKEMMSLPAGGFAPEMFVNLSEEDAEKYLCSIW